MAREIVFMTRKMKFGLGEFDVAMRGIPNIILESSIPYPSGTWDIYSPVFRHM